MSSRSKKRVREMMLRMVDEEDLKNNPEKYKDLEDYFVSWVKHFDELMNAIADDSLDGGLEFDDEEKA